MCKFRLIQGSREINVSCIIKTSPTFKICPALSKLKLVDDAIYLFPPTTAQRLKCLSCENLPLVVVGTCDCQSERDLEEELNIGMETYEPDKITPKDRQGYLAA